MGQRNDPTPERFIRFYTNDNTSGARLNRHPAIIQNVQGGEVIRMDVQRAVRIALTPSRGAENLVGIVRASLSGDQRIWILRINLFLARIKSPQPVEQPWDYQMNLAILMLYQAPDLVIRMGTKCDSGAARANLVEEGLAKGEALPFHSGSTHGIGLFSSKAVRGEPQQCSRARTIGESAT